MENIDLVTLLVQLVAGLVGANIVGALLGNISLGTLGNSIAGLIGGGVGGKLLTSLFALPAVSLEAGVDPTAVGMQAASGAGGGAVVLIVLGILKSLFR